MKASGTGKLPKPSSSLITGISTGLLIGWFISVPYYGPMVSQGVIPFKSILEDIIFIVFFLLLVSMENIRKKLINLNSQRITVYGILVFVLMRFAADLNSLLVLRMHLAFITAVLLYMASKALYISRNSILSIGIMLFITMGFYGITEMKLLDGYYAIASESVSGIAAFCFFIFSYNYVKTNNSEKNVMHFDYSKAMSKLSYRWWFILLSLTVLLFVYIQGNSYMYLILDVNPMKFDLILFACWILYSISVLSLTLFLINFRVSFTFSFIISLAGLAFTIGLASFNNNFLVYVSFVVFTILSAIVDYVFLAVFLSYGLKTHKVTSIAWGLLAYCFIMEYAAFNSILLSDIFRKYNFIFLMVPILACLFIIPVMIYRNKWKVPEELSITVRKKATFEEHLVSLLTMSEKHIFELMCKGFSNRQLSEQLNITESTVKFHIRNILKKANARNRYDLLSMIHESDYITSK
ncbi:MAG: helix-turn-helix transcriptional regulator [Clostridiaceae bacterium]|nr:helix-turn-helix transcriptional regulator [Clostridiaceae bacterium]